MDRSCPAVAAIIERVISYLGKKDLTVCKTINKTWYTLVTIQSARNIDCHVIQLPLRIAYYRRKGLLNTIRSLTIDLSYLDGYLSAPTYERRICDAAALLDGLSAPVRHLKLHIPDAHSALSNNEIYFGSMALSRILSVLPRLSALDLSDCPVSLLSSASGGEFSNLTRLQKIRWFSLGRNDMSSATALYHLVSSNQHTLTTLYGKSDVTDRTLQVLCTMPNLQRLDASGSSISDDSLLELVHSRGGSMRKLVLSDCTRLTRRSISHLVPKALPRLASLDLYNVMVTTDTYQSLFNAQTYWPYLRDLKLKAAIPHTSPRHDSLVNDDILEAIGQNCPRLVSLRLFGCHGITDNGLSSILGNLGYLRELVVMHSASEPIANANISTRRDAISTQHRAPSSHSTNTANATATASHLPQPSQLQLQSQSQFQVSSNTDSGNNNDDVWAGIPSLPSNAPPSHQHQPIQIRRTTLVSPPSTAPNSPRVSDTSGRNERRQNVFTSHALHRGVRSKRFNLLNLDMEYDSVCAEHLAKLTHLHVLCGRMITRHAKSLIESQFPKCKMMVWNID
ncbi:hypothetical protein GGI25_001164 [Coemansia spiralis]|uniref:RNI-like protein n=2 Tax=Coemansia TaxID=4863 RepID=A0A9W8GAM6_9FUNG|nr:hypothetical protein BX070DRAFT_255292 [Coemansia spiralis]KAJ1995597.1 hypothetical protein EDC05_000835 [Coemansia umbellata]KAJ2625071.1 hypothetical protein GGI26_000874 [Coemansia sp. RSA 1358]KAJ2679975.1 hypothetical protein GGI25_001164 [Coemansia spiralis]